MPRSIAAALTFIALCGSLMFAEDKSDPVESLRKALRPPTPIVASEQVVKEWLRAAERAADNVRKPADLCRALLLPELNVRRGDVPGAPLVGHDPQSNILVLKLRHMVAERAVTALRDALRRPAAAPEATAALVSLVGEIVVNDRNAGQSSSPLTGLAQDVIRLHASEKNRLLRRCTLVTLGRVGATPELLVPAFLLGLSSADDAERRSAAEVLARLVGPKDPPRPEIDDAPFAILRRHLHLAPVAGKHAKGADRAVQLICLEALGHMGKATHRELHYSLPHPDEAPSPTDREAQAQFKVMLLELWKEARPTVAALDTAFEAATAALEDKELPVRLAAARALEGAATARVGLREMATHFDAGGPDMTKELTSPVRAVPALSRLLMQKEVRARLAALYVLETLAADAAPAAESLAKSLADESRFVRWGAARALRNMAPAGAEKSVTALAAALSDNSADVRSTAAVALGRCGPKAKAAIGALSKAIAHEDEALRLNAAVALGGIGGGEAALAAALADDRPPVRSAAAKSLARVGKLGAASRAALVRALDDRDEDVRVAAATALLGGE